MNVFILQFVEYDNEWIEGVYTDKAKAEDRAKILNEIWKDENRWVYNPEWLKDHPLPNHYFVHEHEVIE